MGVACLAVVNRITPGNVVFFDRSAFFLWKYDFVDCIHVDPKDALEIPDLSVVRNDNPFAHFVGMIGLNYKDLRAMKDSIQLNKRPKRGRE